MATKKMLAVDLGASSGRGIIGGFDGEKFTLEEIHRFSNDPVSMPGGFFWDTLRLLFEIKTAILKSSHAGGIDSVGIDTWGVDYGYLDKTLLHNARFHIEVIGTAVIVLPARLHDAVRVEKVGSIIYKLQAYSAFAGGLQYIILSRKVFMPAGSARILVTEIRHEARAYAHGAECSNARNKHP